MGLRGNLDGVSLRTDVFDFDMSGTAWRTDYFSDSSRKGGNASRRCHRHQEDSDVSLSVSGQCLLLPGSTGVRQLLAVVRCALPRERQKSEIFLEKHSDLHGFVHNPFNPLASLPRSGKQKTPKAVEVFISRWQGRPKAY
ncbi:hypothetical protein [Bradyrhizobium sp. dw_411]|uniref:hypothetical protein n=1 Tax=Bradyrhizobium sp. dw_411 TaxID=2720082 RepID=UPI001BCFAFCE|nr:hypothetical protein [Bradyrhizobium sp. dw_411]